MMVARDTLFAADATEDIQVENADFKLELQSKAREIIRMRFAHPPHVN